VSSLEASGQDEPPGPGRARASFHFHRVEPSDSSIWPRRAFSSDELPGWDIGVERACAIALFRSGHTSRVRAAKTLTSVFAMCKNGRAETENAACSLEILSLLPDEKGRDPKNNFLRRVV